MKKIQVFALALALGSPAAFGQMMPRNTYFGASIGQSHTTFDNADFAPGAGNTSADDRNDTSWKLFLGYRFTPIWAIEGGYANHGNFSRTATGAAGTTRAVVENTSWFLAGKGTMALTPTIGLFGKLGVTRNESDTGVTTTVAGATGGNASDSRTGIMFGVGMEWAWTQSVSVRVEYEDYGKFGNQVGAGCATICQTGRTRTNVLSLGLTHSF
jgi:OOP family OmpA-OmpF porin